MIEEYPIYPKEQTMNTTQITSTRYRPHHNGGGSYSIWDEERGARVYGEQFWSLEQAHLHCKMVNRAEAHRVAAAQRGDLTEEVA